jgi:hypothetical protein
VAWTCSTRAIDHRVAQVLRNTLVMFDQVVHPVESLQMVSDPSPGSPARSVRVLGIDPMDEVYPPVSAILGFRARIHPNPGHNAQRIVTISFARPLPDPELQTILEWLDDWGEAVRGAYADDEDVLETGDCAIFDVAPDIEDDVTIEMPILRVGAPDVAWNSLLNLCGRIGTDVATVTQVEIV